jgi:cell division protein FtsQ
MPRVRKPRQDAAALAMPRQLQDRPGRWKLVWRRQRRRMRPVLFCVAVLALGLVLAGSVRGLGRGANFHEQMANVSARLGLRITTVRIEGREKTPEPVLNAALGVRPGEAILTYSVSEARTRLEMINWVESATVERRLPGTLVVTLKERRPFAVWQTEGKFVLIDRDGNKVTDSNVANFSGQLPLVVGAGAPQAARLLVEALAEQPALLARMSAAVRVGERRWNLHMDNGTDVMLPEGEEKRALARLAELQASHALLDRPLQVVDLRLPDRLVVRPVPEKIDPPTRPTPPRKT